MFRRYISSPSSGLKSKLYSLLFDLNDGGNVRSSVMPVDFSRFIFYILTTLTIPNPAFSRYISCSLRFETTGCVVAVASILL
jgi:hypothetical protein